MNWFQRFILSFICLLGGIIAGIWMIILSFFPMKENKEEDRLYMLFKTFDRAFNTATGGKDTETLSSRAGRGVENKNCNWCKVLCWFLNLFEKDHCKKSIGV